MSIGTLFAIAAAASVLAHAAATKRGRNAQGWAVLAFLFPITLVVLWCLNSRPAAPGPASVAKTPVVDRPSGWAAGQSPGAGQHLASNEAGTSPATLAESW